MVSQIDFPTRTFSPHTVATATLWGAVSYGLLRFLWTVTGTRPELPPTGDDLHIFSDWGIVVLCVAAAISVAALRREEPGRYPRASLIFAMVVVALMAISVVLILLDVVGLLLLAGSGIPTNALAIATRMSVALIASGVFVSMWYAYRRWVADCISCGRRVKTPLAWNAVPGWAFVAAYMAVAGYVVRILVQLPFDGPTEDISSSDLVSLAVLASGAGVLLPLALVYRFGRVWPDWVPVVAGRAVPRRLVLIPAVLITVGMTIYFGINFIGLVFMGPEIYDSSFPDWFWWTSIGSYVVWGAGLAGATYAYARVTKRRCNTCGRR